jgi:hypothetical protein
MLRDPNKKAPELKYCTCKEPQIYLHTNNKFYCGKCGFEVREDTKDKK